MKKTITYFNPELLSMVTSIDGLDGPLTVREIISSAIKEMKSSLVRKNLLTYHQVKSLLITEEINISDYIESESLSESNSLCVGRNYVGEVLITNKQSNHTLRISDYMESIIVTCSDNCILTPISKNGIPGVRTYPRHKVIS